MIRYIFSIILLSGLCLNLNGQINMDTIQNQLDRYAQTDSIIHTTVDLTVFDVSIQEFVNALASTSKINLSVDPGIHQIVSYTFTEVPVYDVILYLCKNFDLELIITGSIIHLKKAPEVIVSKETPIKLPVIVYDKQNELLSFDLSNDNLYEVTKAITIKSGSNVSIAPGLNSLLVSSFVKGLPMDKALDHLAFSNELELKRLQDNSYRLSQTKPKTTVSTNNKSNNRNSGNRGNNKNNKEEQSVLTINIPRTGYIDIVSVNSSINEILSEVASMTGDNYMLLSEATQTVSMNLVNVTFEEFMDNLLNGTDLIHQKPSNIHLIGDKTITEFIENRLIYLNFRTVEKLLEVIPEDITDGITVVEFIELNALVVSGNKKQIDHFESFIKEIDKLVPVILIEVIIIDNNSNHAISTGISAGIGSAYEGLESGGVISPGVDFQLNTESVNKLINSFNGFGWFKIGKVNPGFYLSLKALEDQGVVKLRSTPMLSTLNGHEASINIGNTEYYLEERHDVIGNENPQNVTTRTYKPINADMSLTIKPFVAGDEHITLEIEIKQSDFTSRISPDAPPGAVSRDFKSYIRVKNQEMVLLGGLEEKSSSNTGTGIPFLSRVPVIKWIFSSRSKSKASNKLNIFIKPTIIN